MYVDINRKENKNSLFNNQKVKAALLASALTLGATSFALAGPDLDEANSSAVVARAGLAQVNVENEGCEDVARVEGLYPGRLERITHQIQETFLEQLEEEKKAFKGMKKGQKQQKAAKNFGRAADGLLLAAPAVISATASIPPVGAIVAGGCAVAQPILRGAQTGLRVFGQAYELHYAQQLSQESYVIGELSEEDRRQRAVGTYLYKVALFRVQLPVLERELARLEGNRFFKKKDTQKRLRELIIQKSACLESAKDKLRELAEE